MREVGDKPSHIDKYFEPFTCANISEEIEKWLRKFLGIHFICVFLNLQREIFDTQLGYSSLMWKMLETAMVGTYIFGVILGLGHLSIFYYWE